MMPAEPTSITLLLHHLSNNQHNTPHPTEVSIAILDDTKPYPERAYAKVDVHLGIHAPDLPQLAREFRCEYASLRRLRYCRIGDDDDDDDDDDAATTRTKNNGNGSNNDASSGGMGEVLTSRILNATTCLLLVCPDHSTAWADRRRALLNNAAVMTMEECALRKELDFCNLLFTQHSKAPSAWSHRKWLGKKLLNLFTQSILHSDDNIADTDSDATNNKLHQWATAEIQMCSTIAEKYPKNYHAWTHRRWVCQSLQTLFLESTRSTAVHSDCSESTDNLLQVRTMVFQLFENELSTVRQWRMTHVTDHSAVHYLGQIVQMLSQLGMHPASHAMVSKRIQCETTTTTTENTSNAWAWDLLSQSMESARSSHFLEYEVTWIYRRICGLACLDYMMITNDKIASDNNNDSRLEDFIRIEITDLAAEYLTEAKKCRKSKIFALSYVVWIVRQMGGSELWTRCPAEATLALAEEVVNVLACDDTIVGNAMRIMNNSE